MPEWDGRAWRTPLPEVEYAPLTASEVERSYALLCEAIAASLRRTLVGRVVRWARHIGYDERGAIVSVARANPYTGYEREVVVDAVLYPRAAERAALAATA